MTEKKIPNSVREIINVFFKYKFDYLTYKMISEFLEKDTNTIIQRIKRNEDFFEIKGKRPYKISLKKNVKEIYFYKDKNQCQICRKTFNPEDLLIRFKDPYMKEKYNWDNCITCCQDCKEKEITIKDKKKRIRKKKDIEKDVWEHKEIYIKKVIKNPTLNPQFQYLRTEMRSWDGSILYSSPPEDNNEDYYEFDEFNGKGWFHLIGDDNEISSLSIVDILDFFGEDGWELVSITEISNNNISSPTLITINKLFKTEERCHCFFKRKKEVN